MRSFLMASSLMLICLVGTKTASGQQSCDFQIVGTWRPAMPDEKSATVYRFASDGKVTVVSASGLGQLAEMRVIDSAVYELDDPKAPTSITFKATKDSAFFARGAHSLRITRYDDSSFTCVKPGSDPTRWIRVDTSRYFIVLAARLGDFSDGSGPAFPILIKLVGKQTQIEAVGTYSVMGKRVFGPVPPKVYEDFMKEPRTDSEVMLRLEINTVQYERGLKILRIWEQRSREDALLYPTESYFNDILLVKAVTESLNRCNEKIKLYSEATTEKYSPPLVPFAYFKELRRLNEALHVLDDRFNRALRAGELPRY